MSAAYPIPSPSRSFYRPPYTKDFRTLLPSYQACLPSLRQRSMSAAMGAVGADLPFRNSLFDIGLCKGLLFDGGE